MTTAVGDIVTEMADVQELVSGSTKESIKTMSVEGLAAKIRALEICDTSAALRLSRALEAASMDPKYRDVLEAAVEARLTEDNSSPGAAGSAKTKQQELVAILNYLTASDWNALEDPGIQPPQLMSVCGSRVAKVGVRWLHEQTVKLIIALVIPLAQVYQNLPVGQRFQEEL